MVVSVWRLVTYGLIVVVGCLIALPNLIPASQLNSLPGWLPKQQVALGLDLRGGAHLVLEIDSQALRKEQLDALLGSAQAMLREQRIPGARGSISRDAVIFQLADPARTATVAEALRAFAESSSPDSVAAGRTNVDVSVAATGEIVLRPTQSSLLDRQRTALEQSIEIVRRRIDAVGVAEPTVQRLGSDRILVQLPGVQDPAAIRTLLGSTAKLTFHLVGASEASAVAATPAGQMRVPDAERPGYYFVERQPLLQGDRLIKASAGIDQTTGSPIVAFGFDETGARIFADITRRHVGEQLAIVLDGKVISAPVINGPIVGGAGQIEGRFTIAQTSSLAALLRAGALPVPLQIIEERMVGPDLGSDAIRAGAVTGVIGLLLVLGFMTVLYGIWGLVANLALIVNVALTLAALTLLGATLTLPGIAGIVLGIGLAVDANVLINERIREETRNGKSAYAALQSGFKRAYATIVDANVTTLIATTLLFWVGSGPVRGFAVTMALGIVISMFTAVAVVRMVMTLWIQLRRPKQFVIGSLLPARLLNYTPHFRFMRARLVGIGLSIVLSLASVGLVAHAGLNYGVDFTGGILVEASTPAAAPVAALRAALEKRDIGEITLQEIGDASSVLVRIQQPPGTDDSARTQIAEKARDAILEVEPQARFDRVEIVGPKISSELVDMGILAVLLASIAMLIYIWIRFEWHFAVGAIATLLLDVTKTLGFFALTGIEFNLTAIAALLTIIGYSVNDKVVVYDRMRENLKLHPSLPLRELIDRSINETLARSLYTSATAFLAIVPLAIWGGAIVQSFAIPMVFGIVIAASSSVFIAAPILLFLGDWRVRRARSSSSNTIAATASDTP